MLCQASFRCCGCVDAGSCALHALDDGIVGWMGSRTLDVLPYCARAEWIFIVFADAAPSMHWPVQTRGLHGVKETISCGKPVHG